MAETNWVELALTITGIPEDKKFDANDDVHVQDISDGYLNDVFRVYEKDDQTQYVKSCILKHSMPYIKCLGEAYPLSVDRIDNEYKALVKFHTLSPGSVPTPYGFSKEHNTVCMEDMLEYELLRRMLMRGEFNMGVAETIGRHLGIVHRETHLANIGQEALDTLRQEFENSKMVSLVEEFVFKRPFIRDDETNKSSDKVKEVINTVYDDPEVLAAAQKMLKLFLEKKECLIHGDLHTGSILVKGHDARMFDLECSFVGPAAYDLGALIANFIFSYHRNISIEETNVERRNSSCQIIDACKTMVSCYLDNMTAPVQDRAAYVRELMSETAGFAGCEIVRRLVGTAHNADLEGMPLAEQDCLGAGVRLLKAAHRIHNADQLMVIALMLAPGVFIHHL